MKLRPREFPQLAPGNIAHVQSTLYGEFQNVISRLWKRLAHLEKGEKKGGGILSTLLPPPAQRPLPCLSSRSLTSSCESTQKRTNSISCTQSQNREHFTPKRPSKLLSSSGKWVPTSSHLS